MPANLEKFRDTADPQWERRINSFEETTLTANPANFAGIDPIGKTDSTSGLLFAMEEASALKRALYVPPGKYKIGTSGTGLTMATVKWTDTGESDGQGDTIIRQTIICDPATVFEGAEALTTNPVVSCEAPAGKIYFNCNFQFGQINRVGTKREGPCFKCRNFSEGKLSVAKMTNGSVGFIAESFEESNNFRAWWANNVVELGQVVTCKNGIQVLSPKFSPQEGAQGNLFTISAILGGNTLVTETGLLVDEAASKNSTQNEFRIGVIGQCKNNGIVVHTPENRFFLTAGTGNVERDYYCLAKECYFDGWCETGTTVETLGAGLGGEESYTVNHKATPRSPAISPGALEKLTLSTKVEEGTFAVRSRTIPGPKIELRGNFKVKAAEAVKAGEVFAELKTGWRPSAAVRVPIGFGATTEPAKPGQATIKTSGAMELVEGSTEVKAGELIYLDNINFPS